MASPLVDASSLAGATPPVNRAVASEHSRLLPLHPLLATRRTRRAFDPTAEVTSQELAALLEAARWAPSSFNTQPWRFVVGRRDDDSYQKIFAKLMGCNQRWAGRAPLLLVGAHLTRSETGAELQHAAYDLGQAVAHLAFQATSLGLSAHQMSDFDAEALHAALELPQHAKLEVVIAVGRLGDPEGLPADLREQEVAPRQRQHVATLLLT